LEVEEKEENELTYHWLIYHLLNNILKIAKINNNNNYLFIYYQF
jgi:hypothetical protein